MMGTFGAAPFFFFSFLTPSSGDANRLRTLLGRTATLEHRSKLCQGTTCWPPMWNAEAETQADQSIGARAACCSRYPSHVSIFPIWFPPAGLPKDETVSRERGSGVDSRRASGRWVSSRRRNRRRSCCGFRGRTFIAPRDVGGQTHSFQIGGRGCRDCGVNGGLLKQNNSAWYVS